LYYIFTKKCSKVWDCWDCWVFWDCWDCIDWRSEKVWLTQLVTFWQHENILGDWLLPMVDKYLDLGQCGGLKNTSVNHYLVNLLNFVHTAVDQPTPTAVVMAALDLSKAYNRGWLNGDRTSF
jgi:hypothetical protein